MRRGDHHALNSISPAIMAAICLGRRNGETPDFEIELVRRTIAEINTLHEKLGERRGTRSIAAEDLNASNDE